jgi:hypothetical protein
MIAGPDLAGAYMEPDEFLAFVDRSLHRRFIADPAELPARLAALDGDRDPDGRCRVSELFCSNHTWQPAVLALMDRAGVVLLDLREYGPARAGTRFELEQVLARVPLARVLLLVDADAPIDATTAEVQRAWRQVGGARGTAAAPTRGSTSTSTSTPTPAPAPAPAPTPTLQLLQVGRGSAAEMRGLLRAAAQAAAS